MKKLIIILSAVLLFITGCKKEYDLQKSVYISDPDLPELPAYSEWGYNTFGALYDREVFKSNDYLVPAKIVSTDNSLSIILDGQLGSSGYYYDYNEMIMTFKLKGLSASEYPELTALNDTIIDLKDPLCQVSISVDSVDTHLEILSGGLFFKRAQFLRVDNNPIEVILSGTFELKAILNNKPITISDGRFDVGIGSDNFYSY